MSVRCYLRPYVRWTYVVGGVGRREDVWTGRGQRECLSSLVFEASLEDPLEERICTSSFPVTQGSPHFCSRVPIAFCFPWLQARGRHRQTRLFLFQVVCSVAIEESQLLEAIVQRRSLPIPICTDFVSSFSSLSSLLFLVAAFPSVRSAALSRLLWTGRKDVRHRRSGLCSGRTHLDAQTDGFEQGDMARDLICLATLTAVGTSQLRASSIRR